MFREPTEGQNGPRRGGWGVNEVRDEVREEDRSQTM